jgi:hypothetical protein
MDVPDKLTLPQGMCSGQLVEENPVCFEKDATLLYCAMQYQLNYRLLSVIN